MPASDLAAILSEVRSLRTEFEQFREETNMQRAYDRKRISALEVTEPQPLQKDRAEILRALLAANGGKMLAKDSWRKMKLNKMIPSRLVESMDDTTEVKSFHADLKKYSLILRSTKGGGSLTR
jgi:hypothetical protein